MSVKRVSLAEANGQLAELIELAKRGDEVVIESDGKSQVRLVAVAPVRKTRAFGQHKDSVWMSPNFNDPLPPEVLLGSKP